MARPKSTPQHFNLSTGEDELPRSISLSAAPVQKGKWQVKTEAAGLRKPTLANQRRDGPKVNSYWDATSGNKGPGSVAGVELDAVVESPRTIVAQVDEPEPVSLTGSG